MTVTNARWTSPIPSPYYPTLVVVIYTCIIRLATSDYRTVASALSLQNEVRSRPTDPPIYQPHMRLSMV